MKLSGWVRLWIVASVIWWAAGAWWLVENFRPDLVEVKPAVFSKPPLPKIQPTEDVMREMLDRSDQLYLDALEGRTPRPPTADEVRKRMAERAAEPPRKVESLASSIPELITPPETRDDWTRWLASLGIVIFAPLMIAVTFLGLRAVAVWVWRGFRPPKKDPPEST